MKNDDVDRSILPTVIQEVGPRFGTKDVSTDSRVVAAHPGATTGELNTAVGRILSRDRDELRLELVNGNSNALWKKIVTAATPVHRA